MKDTHMTCQSILSTRVADQDPDPDPGVVDRSRKSSDPDPNERVVGLMVSLSEGFTV